MKTIGFFATFLMFFSAFGQYSNTYQLKEARKVGIGPVFGGAYGKWGVKLDLNFEQDNSVVTGVGGSDSYNSFNIGWKHDFEGTFTHLYSNVGFAKLFSSNQVAGRDEYLIDQLQAPEDGKGISQDLTVFGLGFQYNELGEDFAGFSFFLEGNVLHSWQSAKLIPTGTLGLTYFF